jgi:hypothetical protein
MCNPWLVQAGSAAGVYAIKTSSALNTSMFACFASHLSSIIVMNLTAVSRKDELNGQDSRDPFTYGPKHCQCRSMFG